MPLRVHGRFHSVDGPAWAEHAKIPWQWKFISYLASWMVLGGYLILTDAYESDATLRFSSSVLYVFVVGLLTAGYSLSVMLCFVSPNLSFRADSVFLPIFISSLFGLLTLFYKCASSTNFFWGTASIVSVVISSCAAVIYLNLFIWTRHRISTLRLTTLSDHKLETGSPALLTSPAPTASPAPSTLSAPSTSYTPRSSLPSTPGSAQSWQSPAFYANYNANMYPTAVNPPKPAPMLTEDELVNQQMAMLLARADTSSSAEARFHTFHIDLPTGHGADESRPQTSYGDQLSTPGQQRNPLSPVNSSFHTDRQAGLSAWERVARAQDRNASVSVQPDRSARPQVSREQSREDRRREIEMGTMNNHS